MNRRQRKKRNKAQQLTIILGCKIAARAEQYEKMRKSIEYQLRAGSVILLPAYLHVEGAADSDNTRYTVEVEKEESEAAQCEKKR